ncbi:3-oxoacyl-ACP reductase [Salsipaludibacter albus]|uniref:3-oxoacyl-ACP reductase n=1 Tax=Salsipaludibacter albus TaxID=2849650 RepID=UPI001EE3FC89|nr:3-oxoacyl-ACP reductase [Salsipaludibacter albus]
MSDLYSRVVNHEYGRKVADLLGLPTPAELRRHVPGEPPLTGPVLVGGDGDLSTPVVELLRTAGLDVHTEPADPEHTARYAALVFDATGMRDSTSLGGLHEFFHTMIRRLGGSGRIVVLGRAPEAIDDPAAHAAQRSLEGFVRAIGKELRAGGTANLVTVAPGADDGIAAPLRFLLSGRSAYVSGQRLPVVTSSTTTVADLDRPHAGRVAVVTGAARGIGESIARTLARDGATIVGVDLPSSGDALAGVVNDVGGTALQLDITADDAGERLVDHVRTRHGHLDVLVNNAGITRDKTIAGMDRRQWDMVLGVNLTAMESLDRAVLDADDVLGDTPRIVCLSSMNGIAGARGQTNYATSKAGVIGHVAAMADPLADRDGTINAVAPGFIETDMTEAMPMASRELGRRLNSLSQGGLPVDVAEAISFLAWPDADGVNGTTLRVCGQNLLGA